MKDYVLNLGYDDITLTGHSLDGNLAMHAAVSAYEISSNDARAISNVVSFDGPGFSDDYMIRHYMAISSINGQRRTSLSHFTWSLVGVLLNQLEGTYDWKTKVGAGNVELDLFERHDMTFAQYDNKDNLLSATKNESTMLEILEDIDKIVIDALVECPVILRPNIVSLLFRIIENATFFSEFDPNKFSNNIKKTFVTLVGMLTDDTGCYIILGGEIVLRGLFDILKSALFD